MTTPKSAASEPIDPKLVRKLAVAAGGAVARHAPENRPPQRVNNLGHGADMGLKPPKWKVAGASVAGMAALFSRGVREFLARNAPGLFLDVVSRLGDRVAGGRDVLAHAGHGVAGGHQKRGRRRHEHNQFAHRKFPCCPC